MAISAMATLTAAAAARPHLVMSIIDDLGYAGLGFSSPSGEPRTPVIDALAKESAVLTHHYTFRFCSPTRSSFLTGRLPLHVNQQNRPPNVPGGGIPLGMRTIADKLRSVGYDTVHAGKWHGGFSHAAQLPIHRGFNSSLAMLSGAADHYTNERMGAVDLWLNDKPASQLNGTYSLYSYTAHAIAGIEAHAAAADPSRRLFLYMAFQDVHGPTEAPPQYYSGYSSSIWKHRLDGLAQVAAVDEAISNLTAALRRARLWEETLMVVSSDNGGPADHEANWPLRGSKGNEFEGGVRVVAFVVGGFLPDPMRGTSVDGLMHITDWHTTFAALAGVAAPAADGRAAALGLPAVDSLDVWPMVSGANTTSPRVELPLNGNGTVMSFPGTGLIVTCPASPACRGSHGRFKLLRGSFANGGSYPGPTTPNGTKGIVPFDCGRGCIFDLDADPTEHNDLAAHKPTLLRNLIDLAEAYDATTYQSPGGAGTDPKAIQAADAYYGGFWGPWQDDAVFAALVAAPAPMCDDCM